MSQHSERTQNGPSRVSIVAGFGLLTTVMTVTAWIGIGAENWREVAGLVLGVFASVLVLAQVTARVVERMEVQERKRRKASEGLWNRLREPVGLPQMGDEDDLTTRLDPGPLRAAPVFRSERERAAWLDAETEVIRH
jgi:hypothetical protein